MVLLGRNRVAKIWLTGVTHVVLAVTCMRRYSDPRPKQTLLLDFFRQLVIKKCAWASVVGAGWRSLPIPVSQHSFTFHDTPKVSRMLYLHCRVAKRLQVMTLAPKVEETYN